ncbi:MAG: ABC transporter ATP-binding protein [Planctomycetia bacterium]|nr:ABC transporter ATP-binding protein [Planctomycetia bacterium]
MIRLTRISRSYGPVRALSNVTLSLEPGTAGLVGNNGAGKSTLLKILLGLLEPDAGSGTVLSHDILSQSREIRGKVGYMPESAAIVTGLKGVEYVTLSGDLYGMPHRDARRRAHEVLGYVGLGELRYRRLEEYSTGNVQRLKLAAALVHDPKLLLLDEPTNGLDPAGRAAMLRLIQDLIADTGKSVLLCTHLLGDVERLCRQVVILHRGTVVEAGPLAELRAGSGDRYELSWQHDGEAFVAALRAEGVEPLANGSHAAAPSLFSAPRSWTTVRFFELAARHGVVITHLKRHEEDLEQLFFRVTDGEGAAAGNESAVASSETVPAGGSKASAIGAPKN